MTIGKVIRLADALKPNAIGREQKYQYINEVEGLVQSEVMLLVSDDIVTYDCDATGADDTVLLVKPPHDKLYIAYIVAMIDFANGEYNKYANTIEQFNTYYAEYHRWYFKHFHPADGECTERGYYLSAYTLAVLHGFVGDEDAFVASMVGKSPEMRYTADGKKLEWKYTDEGDDAWRELIDLGTVTTVRDEAISAAVTAEEKAAIAQQAVTDAQNYAIQAEDFKNRANNNALLALEANSSAYKHEQNAKNYAEQAKESSTLGMTAAKVGDYAKVAEVDENGVPTRFEAADIIDENLTEAGKAADAAAVGERLSNLSEEKVSLPKAEDGTAIPGTAGWYAVSDGAGGITWVESAPSTGGGGETTTHGIVWDLVNVTSSNNAVSVADGASLVAVLTPADGYTLGDVIVTMGGVDITADVWNAETATIIIEAVTGEVAIYCAGVGDVQIIPVFSYGNIASGTGSADTSTARQHSELINCMTKGLRIDVPATSDYYSVTTGATNITYSVFAYDADGNYISGVDSSGKVLESAATFGGWLTCKHGESIYLPSGYQYVFVNSNSSNPKPFDSNNNAYAFCNSGELKFYLIVGGDSGSTTTTNEEASVMMLSFNRAYVDTGKYTEDLLPKWDGMFSIHRGYSTAPNNTLQAIWEAKKHGYNCCELDVRYTSDNQVVLNHDATVTGTVDGVEVTYTIAYTPLATLQTVCIGNTGFPDAKVCSLEDAMRLCRRIGMRPEIDYKVSNEQLYKDCVALSMKYGLQDDTLHCCYGMSYALTVKTEYEKANLRVDGALLDSDTSLDEYIPKPGNLYAFYSAAACGKTDGSNVGANVDNETRILTHKAKGYKMYVWNVTPNLLPDVMQWEPDILQPQSARDTSDWYTLIRELNSFDGLIW